MSTYNRSVNIFKTIGKVTSRTEPFHSRFLADALIESLTGNRSLFDTVWKLAAPLKWNTPDRPEILSEKDIKTGRIDVCIHDKGSHRVLGIEVKTDDDSVEYGQLKKYYDSLTVEDAAQSVAIGYLTPFNRDRAEDADTAAILKAVKEFEDFCECYPCAHARHVSWLDVADISWDGNELWKQHQHYVRNTISSPTHLQASTRRDRPLDEFFGEDATRKFWEALADMGISPGDNGADINLAGFRENLSPLTSCLVSALEKLICDGCNVSNRSGKPDQFLEDLRKPFLNSPYEEIHAALFNLSKRFCHVWIKGVRDYGVRVAHKEHGGGVSLITSQTPDRLKVGRQR